MSLSFPERAYSKSEHEQLEQVKLSQNKLNYKGQKKHMKKPNFAGQLSPCVALPTPCLSVTLQSVPALSWIQLTDMSTSL